VPSGAVRRWPNFDVESLLTTRAGVTVETSRREYLTFDKASSSFRRNSDVHLLRKRGASIRKIKYSMMSTALNEFNLDSIC
jgi:hypothetical protein